MDDRIIALIDMDCFYVQCEQRLEPDKWHKPCVVAQYNNWKGGGIIAVNYEARAFGIKRGWMGDQAQKVCPELHIFKVPDENGKAKLDRYRDASVEVFQTIANFIEKEESALGIENLVILERASVDEAFIDLTKLIDAKPLILYDYETMMQFNTKLEFDNIPLEDWLNQPDELDQNDKRLIMAAHLVGQLRQRILEETQFKCSAGISHNKMLSKLACGLNKPNAQTILPMKAVQSLFKRIDIRDVRSLGGKLGRQIKDIFQIQTMYQLSQLSRALLNETFDDKTAEWLYDLANGIDREPVSDRRLTKSIGCGKNFRGKSALSRISDINHWIHALLKELYERITKDKETNQRLGKLMVVGYFTAGKGHCHRSVSIDVQCGDYPSLERLASDIMKQVFPNSIATTIVTDPLQNLSLAVTKFVDAISLMNNEKIEQFFTKIDRNTFVQRQQQQQKESTTTTTNERPSPIKKRSLDQLKTTVKKSPTKKAKLIQTNTLDRYLRPSTSNQYASDDNDNAKIDMNDPHVRQINREFDELLDSFFYRKILFMLENGEWRHTK